MANSVIVELERAAAVILAPPNTVSAQERKTAEEVFINLNKTENPYNFCRQILESSRDGFVLFQVVKLLKTALIREWSSLPEDDIVSLKQYLLHYVITTDVPFCVREKVFQILAIMVKRHSCENFGLDSAQVLGEIEGLIMSGDSHRQLIGCGLLTSIMQEYASSSKSSDVGLAWEIHFRAKRSFESIGLPRIFKFIVQAWSELLQGDPPFSPEVYNLTQVLLAITESVLTWGYISPLPRRLVGLLEDMQEANQAAALRLGLAWRDIILDPNLLRLFFTTYWKIRDQPSLAHHGMTCLVQFATLSGGCVDSHGCSDGLKIKYITFYLEGFLKLLESIDLKDYEVLGISNIVRKLVSFYPPRLLVHLPRDILHPFCERVAQLTCRFAEGAAQEEAIDADDRVYMEAFDNILEAWMTILRESQFSNEQLNGLCVQVFNTYLRCHLSAPEGTRNTREIESEEINENEESDELQFRDQLKTIGLIGRQILSYTVPLLSHLLEARTKLLQEQLIKVHNTSFNISNVASLDYLFEDLHWLVLLAGNVICMDSEGETAMIPSEIIKYSLQNNKDGKVNADLTLKLLASPNQHISDIPGAEEFADPVIRLIAAIFRLCEIEKSAADAKLQHSLSPEVGSTVIWFLKSFAESYLMPNENIYREICPTILAAFGVDTEGSLWTCNFLLAKIHSNIVNFLSEIILLTDSVQFLVSLVSKCGPKGSAIAKSEGLWNLIKFQSQLDPGTLPQAAKRGLYHAFTICASSLSEQPSIEYLTQIISPVTNQFKQIYSQDNFNRIYQMENIKITLVDILESLIGICQGAHVRTVKFIFTILTPVMSTLPGVLHTYRNYQIIVQLILELFCECARRMLCFFDGPDSKKMYGYCYSIISTYSLCNSNRITAETTAEDGSFQDILLILDLLINISTKNFIGFGGTDESEEETDPEVPALTSGDVCIYGLCFVMPLMTIELLKYPLLCHKYFRALVCVCEFYPGQVFTVESKLLPHLLGSLELGLTAFGNDVVGWSLEAIQSLATHLFKIGDSQHRSLLLPFLKLIINLILTHQFGNDVSQASAALFALICIYPEEYKELVQSLINSQTNPANAERLGLAFTDLMTNVVLGPSFQARKQFRDRLDKFIVTVNGFLIVK